MLGFESFKSDALSSYMTGKEFSLAREESGGVNMFGAPPLNHGEHD